MLQNKKNNLNMSDLTLAALLTFVFMLVTALVTVKIRKHHQDEPLFITCIASFAVVFVGAFLIFGTMLLFYMILSVF